MKTALNPPAAEIGDLIASGTAVVVDDFLEAEIFAHADGIAHASWQAAEQPGSRWQLRMKPTRDRKFALPLPHLPSIQAMRDLFDKTREDGFTYWYFGSTNTAGDAKDDDVEEIRQSLRTPFLTELLARLGLDFDRYQFSLTAFTDGSYLARHNDFAPGGAAPYRLTLILYFGQGEPVAGGELAIQHDGAVERVSPRPNRAVLFQPGHDSAHEVLLATGGCRLALSGWFTD